MANPARNSHKIIIMISNNFNRGEIGIMAAPFAGSGVPVDNSGIVVEVGFSVAVAGKIKVIAGKGARVVVGVGEGVSVGPGVYVEVPGVPAAACVPVVDS